MDRNWMNGLRTNVEYLYGVNEFCNVAVKHQLDQKRSTILCPCRDCNNARAYEDIQEIKFNLVRRGFNHNYTRWTFHGEEHDNAEGSTKSVGEKLDAVCRDETSNHRDETFNDTDVDEDNEFNTDRVNEMLHSVGDQFKERPHVYESILRAADKPLYKDCSNFSKLSAVLKLFNLKASHGWTDKSFTQLLQTLREMLPEGNELPISTYEAKKLMCPMGMEYEKIHACPNDCVLYRKEYADLQECPRCGLSRYKRKESDEIPRKKGIPAKVLWYLPIIPRFKRLFADAKTAELLRWHADERKDDGFMRHPSDSVQWRNTDRKYETFSEDVRNLRLGLCTDGMNPFGTLSTQYNTWPVLLTIYNLPPWLCMKRRYIMLSLLISGPKQPGNDIDVYLAPLIEDLKLLWDEGVPVFDAYSRTDFTLRAMIFCSINDFPAYGNLSGYAVKGKEACPICMDDMEAVRLQHSQKHVYLNYRTFLVKDHPLRKKRNGFNGKVENKVARLPLRANQIYERVKDIEIEFGKPYKSNLVGGYKKQAIFWQLPYWKDLEVPHCIDVMHVEKNVCDALVGTLLNIPGKTKDGKNARLDMKEMGRPELAPQERGKRYFLPPACFTLSKEEKKRLCESLHGVKVPSGYSSNFRSIVSLKELKLVGMKSHDCHVLIQQLLPVAIRGILPAQVRYAITRLCIFFRTICSKVIDPSRLDELQSDIVQTMCALEMYFPPSFFDVMPHLMVHLVREIKLCGPVCLRYMYPFEREMGVLKGRVMNLAKPEASIVQRTVNEEVASWCAQFLEGANEIGVPQSRHEGRLQGKGTIGRKMMQIDGDLMRAAELFVLQNLAEVHPYVEKHLTILRTEYPSASNNALQNLHNDSFLKWFKKTVMSELSVNPNNVSDTLRWLAYGCDVHITSYQGYDINGFSFYTKRQDDKSIVQNSGVTVVAFSQEYASSKDKTLVDKKSYYGVIQEIYELSYVGLKIALFHCEWVDSRRGVEQDDHGFLTLVNFNRLRHQVEPFIMASQAKQIFYMVDPSNDQWSVVLEGKRRILGIDDVVDEQEYDEQFNETPPSSFDIPKILDAVANHDERIFFPMD
ncbi:hypothetical protein M5689_018900 [Euphorbia peplus]|nr:hypothetical protein M5689_018900 [Euphorbia peplus]